MYLITIPMVMNHGVDIRVKNYRVIAIWNVSVGYWGSIGADGNPVTRQTRQQQNFVCESVWRNHVRRSKGFHLDFRACANGSWVTIDFWCITISIEWWWCGYFSEIGGRATRSGYFSGKCPMGPSVPTMYCLRDRKRLTGTADFFRRR